jgi:hypothetical protein
LLLKQLHFHDLPSAYTCAMPRRGKTERVAKARPIPGQIVVSPTDGPRLHDRILQMKDPWLDEILFQGKTVEVRGQPTKLCGLWLGRHGKVHVFAYVSNVEKIHCMDAFNMLNHHITCSKLPYSKTYA